MEKVWRLILDEAHEPHTNMAIDEAIMLCQKEEVCLPTLRIYRWLYPCISIGRTQNLDEVLMWGSDFPIVKRPTGGGAVFHNEFGFTYSIVYQEKSFVLPRGVLDSYRQVHIGILNGLKSLGIDAVLYTFERNGRRSLPPKVCFTTPAEFDITCGNKKIAGAAQRRMFEAVLHQGEVSLSLDVWPHWSYNNLKFAILKGLSKQLSAKFVECCLSEKEKILAEELAEKFKYHMSENAT